MNPFDQVVSVADNITKENHNPKGALVKEGRNHLQERTTGLQTKLANIHPQTHATADNNQGIFPKDTHTNIMMLYWVMIFIIDFREINHANKFL